MKNYKTLSKILKIKPYVIRFWEAEFDIDFDDVQAFQRVKSLLYVNKLSIVQAKREFLKGAK